MESVAASLVEAEEPGSVILSAAGEWLVETAADLDSRLRALDVPKGKRVTLDLAGIERLDTAGAWLLLRTEHDLTMRGNDVELRNLRPNFEPLRYWCAQLSPSKFFKCSLKEGIKNDKDR